VIDYFHKHGQKKLKGRNMNDNTAKNYFEAAGDLLAAGLAALKADDPAGYAAVSGMISKGGTISLAASISGSGIGEVKCTAALGDDEVLLFSLDAKSAKSH
jgi:hypothetical protein